jgi:mRNA interferase MazF
MKQGEIWLVDLNPTVGAEMRKVRPALIVNADDLGRLPLKIIVPVTDWKERYDIVPWMVQLVPSVANGLSKESTADCFQIRCVAQERLIKKTGRITAEELEAVKDKIAGVIGYEL